MLEVRITVAADPALLSVLGGLCGASNRNREMGLVSDQSELGLPPETEVINATHQPEPDSLSVSISPQEPPAVSTVSSMPVSTVPTAAAVPVAETAYTIDQLAVAASTLMDAGNAAELQEILMKFGVQALTQLPKEQYGAFAAALREKGVKI